MFSTRGLPLAAPEKTGIQLSVMFICPARGPGPVRACVPVWGPVRRTPTITNKIAVLLSYSHTVLLPTLSFTYRGERSLRRRSIYPQAESRPSDWRAAPVCQV